ncbi:hypothetical protein Tco_0092143 [Tanacetum coccineum]
MPPRMTTRSASRSTTAPQGGRTGGRTGRGGGRTEETTSRGDVRNFIVNNNRGGCSYKEFLACNPNDFDGKGGAIAYTRWTKKMESVQDMSGCGDHQKVKYTVGSLMDPWDGGSNEPITIQSDVLKAVMLTDEAIRNGSLRKNTKKRGNVGEPSKDGNVKGDNKRSRTGKAFATTTNLVGPRMVNPLNTRNLIVARGVCFECGGTDHYKAACPRGQGHRNNGNQACGRAFMLGADEARQDLNIVTGFPTYRDEMRYSLKNDQNRKPRYEGYPLPEKIEFRIDLIPEAMTVAKSPYRLAPSEMEELLSQLREL